jgi:hypothetical protein
MPGPCANNVGRRGHDHTLSDRNSQVPQTIDAKRESAAYIRPISVAHTSTPQIPLLDRGGLRAVPEVTFGQSDASLNGQALRKRQFRGPKALHKYTLSLHWDSGEGGRGSARGRMVTSRIKPQIARAAMLGH